MMDKETPAMADDTLTVEQARQRVIQRMRVPTVADYDRTEAARVGLAAVDTLIAAVRAEQRALLNRNAATALIAAQDAGYVLAKPDESS